MVGTQGHTSPEQFGKVMSLVKPRLAIGYHFYNDYDTEPEVRNRVRKTYDGPLALAVDYMVFNVTKKNVEIRMSAVDEEIWPSPALKKKISPDTGSAIAFSEFTISGALGFPEIVQPLFDEINEKYGTKVEPIFKK
jgi:ribonuclease Z